jgi:hypothetical protein
MISVRAGIWWGVVAGLLAAGGPPAHAATITVNSNGDPAGFNTNLTVGTLGGTVTLRDAVTAANNTPGHDIIQFDPALNGATVTLSQTTTLLPLHSGARTNEGPTALRIHSNLELIAPAGGLVILPTGLIRLFDIAAGATMRVERVTLRGGVANNGAGFCNRGALTLDEVTMTSFVASSLFISNTNDLGYGACVFNEGRLIARGSYFGFNNGQSSGGAIFSTAPASLYVTNCTFESNSSEFSGPAIGTETIDDNARITHSVFKGNRVEFVGNWPTPAGYAGGGAVLNAGTLVMSACSFQSNTVLTAQWGGAVLNHGTLALAASTFEANSSSGALARGGAIYSDGTLGLTNCTFAANHARYGSAVESSFGVMMRMVNCTVARNLQTLPETFAVSVGNAFINTLENNLVIENERWDAGTSSFVPANLTGVLTTAGTNFIGRTNVLLGALTTNGGPVRTMALPSGSPAVNAGFAVAGLTNDARGRPRYAQPDLGAYELPTYAPIVTSPTSTLFVIGQSNSFLFTADSGLPVSFAPLTVLPGGTDLTLAGLLFGNPPGPSGLYPLTIRAFNAYNFTDTNFLLIVNDGTLADRFSWQLNGGATLTNGTFTLTDGGSGQARSAWYLFKQDINAFQASFEYLDVGGGGADGLAFVLQNDSDGVSALGGAGGGLGYLGIAPSFALLVNIYAGAPGGPGIQLSTGGNGLGTNVYIATPAANPASGNPIRFDLYYLNGVLKVTMTNLASNTTFTTNFVVDIPGAVLGNQAWIGLTAATGGATATQRVSNFSFSSLSATATVVVTDAADPAGFNTNLIFSTLGTNVTLRDALTAANNYPGPSVIRFAPALAGATIDLLQTGDAGTGLTALPVTRQIVVENTHALPLTIRRGTAGDLRLFRVFAGAELTLRTLQLSGGRVGSFGQYGGLVHNAGTLTVERCTLSGGYSGGGGGGLYNSGTMSLTASALSSNVTGIGQGFGVGGGGILNQGAMTLTNCTLAFNSAPNSYGGAVWNTAGSMSFHACTIAFNSAFAFGSGIGTLGQTNALCRNCIIADASIFSLLPGSTNNLFFNPGLGAFGLNGGPTPTFPITAASAAHKAGTVDPAVTTDQRGLPRHSPPDIGAYELFPRDPLIVSTTVDENDGSADSTQGTGNSLREALIYAQSVGGPQTITFAPALAGQTLVLDTGWTNTTDASALRVTNVITINGPSNAPGITLSVAPAAQKRHVLIEEGGHLTLQDLTLTGGYAADYGGSIWNFAGSLTVRRCTFAGNSAGGEGGAIQTWAGSPLLVIENSTFVSNTSANVAGAIGTGAVSNSLQHLTVTANSSPNGTFWLYNAVVPLHNSIVAGNTDDGVATFGSGAFAPDSSGNVFGPGPTAGITNGSNGNLTGLAAPALFLDGLSATNGGPTPTVALLPASPAFNRGTNFADLATDQRGQPRVSAGSPDAGAYELIVVESALVTTTNDEFNGTSDARFGTGTSLREAVYCTASPVDVSSNLTGQTLELTMVGDTQFGNSALLFTNPSARTIRAPFAPRTTLRVNSPVPMRHFRIAPGGAVSLQFITLAGGQATNGGAIYNQGTLFVSVAALVSNTASGAGGAVFVESNAILRVTSSTLAGNSAGLRGGAVANRGSNSFQYATLAWNRAASGGGAVYNEAGSSPSTLNASIVAANTDNLGAPSDIGGPSSVSPDSAYNLIGTGGSGGLVNGANSNLVGVADPGLAPLGDYGGRSPTVALYPWSPAIDGSPLLVNAADQRGYLRIFPYDIGAYELLRSTNVVSLAGLKRNGTGGGAGALEFDFAGGVTGATFSVYATTNALIPAHQWQWIGLASETPPGSSLFHGSLPIDTNTPHRLFRVQSP